MHQQPTRCALDNRPALHPSLICRRHDLGLREDLRDVAALYPLLDDVTEPGSVVVDELTRYSKRPDPPAPVRLEVVTLTDTRTTWDPNDPDAVSVFGTLTSWADVIRDEQRLSTQPNATVTSELNVLVTQHDHATSQPWVDDYVRDIHRVAQALRHACGENDQTPAVGRCPVTHENTDTPCSGPLYADRYGLMRVRCARCGEVWDEDDLRRLGLVLTS